MKTPIKVAVVACALMLQSLAANAQATRTWVSGVGDDVNPCSRTAPCKTFAGAISKTAASGTINCIDPGGFGAVTITKTITIDCSGTFGSILAAGTNGVNVTTAGITVILRNIDISGAGSGLIGLNITNGDSVHLENVTINGFLSGSASGIRLAPANVTTSLFINNVSILNNGLGVSIGPSGSGKANVYMNRTEIRDNSSGMRISGAGNTGGNRVGLVQSAVTGNVGDGLVITAPPGAGISTIMISESSVMNNGATGILVDGNNAYAIVCCSNITGNNIGFAVTTNGNLLSYGNNNNNLNITSNGIPTGMAGQQ
jgi:hypothetical protein